MTRLSALVFAASLAVAATATWASGTVGPGGSPSAGEQSLYNAGKTVFARRLACRSCPYAGQSPSAELAREVLADAETLATLVPDEQEALQVYFHQRFGVEN